jgi:tripartite-type tricarboxylate transporter receptor subunit TctC
LCKSNRPDKNILYIFSSDNPMRHTFRLLTCLILFTSMGFSHSQSFPSKTIRIIEPAGPGSAVDSAARDLAPKLTEALGQQVIIDNRPGANSAIGAREAARAPADGHTLFHGNINNALNDLLTNDACCRLGEALLPVTRVVITPLVLVVNAAVASKDLKEFVALAKGQPALLTYASGGPGSITQLLGELVKSRADITLREIPYKAIGAELPDLLAGHVAAAYLAPAVVAQHIQSGKLRALGVAGSRRVAMIPDVPTLAEAGMPDVEASGWNGIFVPRGTPPAVIRLLQADIAKIFATPVYKAQATERGSELGGETPEEFSAFIRSEVAKWGKVIKDSRIKIEQ